MSGRLRLLGQALITTFIALVLFLCLFADRLAYGSSAFGSILREVAATCRDAGSQWMVFLCLAVYFVVCNLLRLRLADRCFWSPNNPDLWLAGALGAGSLVYALNYSAAAASTQALALLAGATLGQGLAVWTEWRRDIGSRNRLLLVLMALLLVGALWPPKVGRDFAYHGHARWTGLWNNPNIFGLLMGMGTVVAAGQLIKRLRITGEKGNAENCSRGRSPSQVGVRGTKIPFSAFFAFSAVKRFFRIAGDGLHIVFFLSAGGIMAVGLLNSYSRGAWLATACGLAYFGWDALRLSRVSRVSLWFRRNRPALSAVLLSVVVGAFWQLHQVEHTVVRRALSAGNVNDFSWRNRVAAWEGALQMMSDRPWLGFGWQHPGRVYDNLYLPPNVAEGAAFQLNDYLMLGASVGLPAFICFLVCVGLSLRGKAKGQRLKAEGRSQKDEGEGQKAEGKMLPTEGGIATDDGVRIACRAGAIALFIGFWFDGGLFTLATAAPFWILLALGQEQPSLEHEVRRQRESGDGALAFDGVEERVVSGS